MPTKREREYYQRGFKDGIGYMIDLERGATENPFREGGEFTQPVEYTGRGVTVKPSPLMRAIAKPKRKLSAWQKYIKNKRNHIKYRDGKLNLKKMGVEFRRKQRR